jgi:hypothetical protein
MSVQDTDYSRPGITSDDAVPAGGSVASVTPGGFAEVAWFCTAADEADTCTVQPWYYHGGAWHKGTSQDLTGSTVVMGYTLGRPTMLRLTSVTGTWQVSALLVGKES